MLIGERLTILAKDLLSELNEGYGIDYAPDYDKFIEHCHRGNLEYQKVTKELQRFC